MKIWIVVNLYCGNCFTPNLLLEMKRIFLVLFIFGLVACSDKEKQQEDLAAKAAKEYYDALTSGQYDKYLSGIVDIDSLPPSYREQLLVNAKQMIAQQQSEHGGIKEVKTIVSKCDSVQKRTDVFLMLCYGDSTKEEIVVPMVECNGEWKMK